MVDGKYIYIYIYISVYIITPDSYNVLRCSQRFDLKPDSRVFNLLFVSSSMFFVSPQILQFKSPSRVLLFVSPSISFMIYLAINCVTRAIWPSTVHVYVAPTRQSGHQLYHSASIQIGPLIVSHHRCDTIERPICITRVLYRVD